MPRPPPRSTIEICARLVDAELGDDVAQQSDHPVRGELEARDVEDLRSDVAVQADQPQVVGGEDAAHRGHRGAAGQRQAELLVLVCGGDELVGVRLDADGDPDQHVLHDARARRRSRRGARSRSSSRATTCPTPALTAAVSSSTDLLLPCNAIRSAGKPACSATASSPPLHDVEREPLLVDPARDLGAQERLGGVADVFAAAERRGDLAAAGPEVVLVDDEQRRAELRGDVGDRHARDRDRRRRHRERRCAATRSARASSTSAVDCGRGGAPPW